MRVQSLLLGAIGLLASTVVAAPAESLNLDLEDAHINELAARVPCHPHGVHVIGSSGDGAKNFHSFGLLGSLVDNIVNNIPHSTNITVPYPKGSKDQLRATTRGAHNLRRYIHKFHKRCPQTNIVLAGYSAGAIMTMNNICGTSSPWPSFVALPDMKKIIAVVVYGDQTFVGGQSYNVGSCTYQGRFPRNPATCAPFANKIKSYCDTPDPECCLGGDVQAHFAYPGLYDSDATQFVLDKYNALH